MTHSLEQGGRPCQHKDRNALCKNDELKTGITSNDGIDTQTYFEFARSLQEIKRGIRLVEDGLNSVAAVSVPPSQLAGQELLYKMKQQLLESLSVVSEFISRTFNDD